MGVKAENEEGDALRWTGCLLTHGQSANQRNSAQDDGSCVFEVVNVSNMSRAMESWTVRRGAVRRDTRYSAQRPCPTWIGRYTSTLASTVTGRDTPALLSANVRILIPSQALFLDVALTDQRFTAMVVQVLYSSGSSAVSLVARRQHSAGDSGDSDS
jgi:hypothetical protein